MSDGAVLDDVAGTAEATLRQLLAISDVHIGHRINREAVASLSERPDDWLIIAGDVGETLSDLEWVLQTLVPRFAQILWVPGNHELWLTKREREGPRGVERYHQLVALCRRFGVLTPEDPWPVWPDDDGLVIAPLFVLYDYSFCPDGMTPEQAVKWAAEDGIVCVDERVLHPDPHPSRQAWCADRIAVTKARLERLPEGTRTVLINHFPLRRDLVRLFRIPRFTPWCGTRETEDWHTRYNADVVVTGHLHMRATDWRDGTRFEEVSLGYPRHWNQDKTADDYLRVILPFEGEAPESGFGGPKWRY